MSDVLLRRPALLATLAVVLLGLAGCTIMYGIAKKAPCPGVTADQIRATLEADPEIEETDEVAMSRSWRDGGAGRQTLDMKCVRKGLRIDVIVREDPDVMTVNTSLNIPPNAAEHAAWLDGVESVAATLEAAHPEIGPWELHDDSQPLRCCEWSCLAFVASLAAGTVGLVRRRRRIARARDETETP